MNFSRRKAVSPIIATLLLIAIAVAAGIIVYVYVNSLAGGLTSGGGSQVSQQLQLQAYTFTGLTGTSGSSNGVIADVFLENTGSSSISISAIYFDGTALTQWYNTAGNYLQYFAVPTAGGNCYALLTSTPAAAALATSQTTSGTSAGSCTSTGVNACQTSPNVCFNAGSVEAPLTTLSAQGTVQLVIGLNAAATSGTSHTVKIVTANGGVAVFSVVAGRTG